MNQWEAGMNPSKALIVFKCSLIKFIILVSYIYICIIVLQVCTLIKNVETETIIQTMRRHCLRWWFGTEQTTNHFLKLNYSLVYRQTTNRTYGYILFILSIQTTNFTIIWRCWVIGNMSMSTEHLHWGGYIKLHDCIQITYQFEQHQYIFVAAQSS